MAFVHRNKLEDVMSKGLVGLLGNSFDSDPDSEEHRMIRWRFKIIGKASGRRYLCELWDSSVRTPGRGQGNESIVKVFSEEFLTGPKSKPPLGREP
jgi:hypothetical protein